jgi:hypothetical protein
MSIPFPFKSLRYFALILTFSLPFAAQDVSPTPYNSLEVSETDGIPVLIKHLPDWEAKRDEITFARDADTLRTALGDRPVFALIDFSTGTEAAAAQYAEGTLLIIEYSNPQSSIDADQQITAKLAETADAVTVYRRIGNYNAFVFDTSDTAAANALLDQVKYEKNVRWLGEDPFLLKRAERAFINSTSDLFVSTVAVIVLGMVLSVVGGLLVGIVYFYLRGRRRATMTQYTDAGGMTRLNLDGFTPDIEPVGKLRSGL